MGYIKHHAIIVTGWREDKVEEAHRIACEIFSKIDGDNIVTNIVGSKSNGQTSFMVAPDGSKEGWETSEECDSAREQFISRVRNSGYVDFVEVVFGGDSDYADILNHDGDDK